MIKQDHIVLNGTWSDHPVNSATTSAIMALALVISLMCLVLSNLTWNMVKRGAVFGASRLGCARDFHHPDLKP
jgi:hypothetical protein